MMKKSLTIAIALVVAMLAPAAHADVIKKVINMEDGLNPAVSADGRFVAFETNGPPGFKPKLNHVNVFVHNIRTGENTWVSPPWVSKSDDRQDPDNDIQAPAISADGRYVAFHSGASNLLPANQDTNKKRDVFVRDLVAGTTERVSVRVEGGTVVQADDYSEAPAISAD